MMKTIVFEQVAKYNGIALGRNVRGGGQCLEFLGFERNSYRPLGL